MDYQVLFGQLFMIIAVLVALVNIFTEVAKKVFDFKNEKNVNVFVAIISVTMTVIVFLAYWQIKQMQIAWYLIVAFIFIGIMVAYAAMLGYDKLLKYFDFFKK